MWEGSLKSHFERIIDFFDFELDFGGLLDLEMLPTVIYFAEITVNKTVETLKRVLANVFAPNCRSSSVLG